MMAGAAEPGVPAGALSMNPMIASVFVKFTAVKMMLQGRQTIDLKYPRDHMFTRYAESHGQLLARRLEAWSSALTYYWIVEYGPNALGSIVLRRRQA
jgi:hypothetical protein